jgi:hypothetical protein
MQVDFPGDVRLARPVPVIRLPWLSLLLVVINLGAWASASAARGAEQEADEPPADDHVDETPVADNDEDTFLARFGPAAVDAPGLRLPEPITRVYVDGTYARSADLSALPFIAGSGHNIRLALGGSWRWRRFGLEAEIPFSQITTLDITAIPGGEPIPEDKHQTATSFGDIRLGATWTGRLPVESMALVAGFGLRARLPTHTTLFQFHLINGGLGQYRFPYYFHIEPTVIFGGSLGRVGFVINQGLLGLTGPDGNFEEIHIVVPNLIFWDAHYALVFAPFDGLALSIDLSTDVQVNRVTVVDFAQLNGIVAVSLSPGIQIHLGDYRIDLVGRIGLTKDAELFGVLQYAGTQSLTLRIGRRFN